MTNKLTPDTNVIASATKYHRIGDSSPYGKLYYSACQTYGYSWSRITTVEGAKAMGLSYCKLCQRKDTK